MSSKKILISISAETDRIVEKKSKKLGITKTEYVKRALLDKLEGEGHGG